MHILTREPTSWQATEFPFAFTLEFLEANDIEYVLEIDGAVLVDLVAADLERYLPVGQVWVPRHFLQHLCYDRHSFAVCAVDYEDYAVYVGVEERPAVPETPLDENIEINFL